MNFAKINIKKLLLVFLAVLLVSYVLWDVSLKAVNHFRLQGYAIAVNEMIRQAENPECRPFDIRSGEKQIFLINIACLQQAQPEQPIEQPE